MARVDKISPKEKIPEYYSDFPINLDKNLVTGQLGRVVNADAVKQAIVSLVLTGRKERPYQPWLGSDVKQSLFDNMDDPLVIDTIKNSIYDCIKANEVRAKIIGINMTPDYDNHSYAVQVYFSIINVTEPQVAEFVLERVR